jgi:hypothetical protein
MAVLVAKLVREERKRSDARVQALLEMASDPDPVPEHPPNTSRPVTARVTPEPAVVAAPPPTRARRERPLDDLQIRPDASVAVAEIFAEPSHTSPWPRRFAVIGMLIVAGTLVIVGLTPRGAAPAPAGTTATERSAQGARPPLELVSLRHTHDGATLTITGLVQNPKGGAPLTRIAVTAVVFAPDGTLVASGKAPLDYTSLGSGDESSFVLTVPVRGAVARYRVGFRSEDGSVVAHVDRRAADVSRAGL